MQLQQRGPGRVLRTTERQNHALCKVIAVELIEIHTSSWTLFVVSG